MSSYFCKRQTGIFILYIQAACGSQARDTRNERQQAANLPRPHPQHPPLTLRYGNLRLSFRWQIMAVPHCRCRLQTHQITARTFDVILLTDKVKNYWFFLFICRQSSRLCLGRLLLLQPCTAREAWIFIDMSRNKKSAVCQCSKEKVNPLILFAVK